MKFKTVRSIAPWIAALGFAGSIVSCKQAQSDGTGWLSANVNAGATQELIDGLPIDRTGSRLGDSVMIVRVLDGLQVAYETATPEQIQRAYRAMVEKTVATIPALGISYAPDWVDVYASIRRQNVRATS